MTPEQMIDKGIETGDLELIKKGRHLLKKKNKEQEGVTTTKGRKKPEPNKDEEDRVLARKEQLNLKKIGKFNLFRDTGDKAESEKDKALYVKPPIPRTRDAFRPVDVTCCDCGKTDTVHPSLARKDGRYKCDKCIKASIRQ